MKIFYKIILSLRDLYSFFAGMIVSGFVVEISINTDNNKFHWFAIIIGLLIGISCYILIKICENFNNNFATGMDYAEAWKSINKNYSTNKIFKILPNIWVPFLPILIIILFILGVYFLNKGNHYNSDLEALTKTKEKQELIKTLDSIYENRIHFFNKENKMLQDSIHREKEIITNYKNIIDSLKKNLIKSKKKIVIKN